MSRSPTEKPLKTSTWIVHGGRDPFAYEGFVNPPVYRGSTVLYKTLEAIDTGKQKFTYGRYGSPTMRALEEAICGLEGGSRTLVQSSGLAAVTTALLSFVKAGDHILVADTVYRPTRTFCNGMLKDLGVETTYYDPAIGADIESLIRPGTRLVYAESPGSQTFELQDIPAIASVTQRRDLWLLVDSTWGSPLYFKPLSLGADVSIQAATKYIVGHADAMLGSLTMNERARPLVEKGQYVLGNNAGTEEIYLGLRGLRTIEVRLERHWRSGLAMADWLAGRPEVERILHPARPEFPNHALWKRDFLGASGLFSVVLKPVPRDALRAMLDGLELFGMGYSWGGYESLVVPFDPAGYRTATSWTGGNCCLRFHIGLEDVADLQADLDAGFARLRAAM